MLRTGEIMVHKKYTTGLGFCPTQKKKAYDVAGVKKQSSGGVLNGASA